MKAFEGSRLIEHINLWNNLLTHIDVATFHDLHRLKEVDQSRNKLLHLDSQIFRGLKNLEKIYLHGNEFEFEFHKLCLETGVKFISFKKDYEKNDLKSIVQSN